MSRPRLIVVGLLVVAGIVALAIRSAVIVDETEFVLVTEFGRPVVVYGVKANETGFHFKWPWQSIRTIDRRLRVFDPPPREMITKDKRNLEVASYVAWRVVEPDRFLRSAGSLDVAESRLNERVSAALSHALGTRELASLASTDPNHGAGRGGRSWCEGGSRGGRGRCPAPTVQPPCRGSSGRV
jgi:membrane protease subunit HflC